MKLRSLQELEDAVDRETAWRKQELTTVLFNAQSEREAKRPTALRAGVALLYAHWEGWIKSVAGYYVGFVVQQRLRYEELSDAFLALALKTRMSQLEEARSARVHIEFAQFLRSELSTQARFPAEPIRTEANLSSEVLRGIVMKLGLDYSPYELHANLIDQRMLDRRNNVAHGEYLDLDLGEFHTLHTEVTQMLRRFTTDVLNESAQRTYRV